MKKRGTYRKNYKAFFFVKQHNKLLPKIHNLARLAEISNLELTDFCLETRYPDTVNIPIEEVILYTRSQ